MDSTIKSECDALFIRGILPHCFSNKDKFDITLNGLCRTNVRNSCNVCCLCRLAIEGGLKYAHEPKSDADTG